MHAQLNKEYFVSALSDYNRDEGDVVHLHSQGPLTWQGPLSQQDRAPDIWLWSSHSLSYHHR